MLVTWRWISSRRSVFVFTWVVRVVFSATRVLMSSVLFSV